MAHPKIVLRRRSDILLPIAASKKVPLTDSSTKNRKRERKEQKQLQFKRHPHGLNALPGPVLLRIINQYLDPASVVCLALTSHTSEFDNFQ